MCKIFITDLLQLHVQFPLLNLQCGVFKSQLLDCSILEKQHLDIQLKNLYIHSKYIGQQVATSLKSEYLNDSGVAKQAQSSKLFFSMFTKTNIGIFYEVHNTCTHFNKMQKKFRYSKRVSIVHKTLAGVFSDTPASTFVLRKNQILMD